MRMLRLKATEGVSDAEKMRKVIRISLKAQLKTARVTEFWSVRHRSREASPSPGRAACPIVLQLGQHGDAHRSIYFRSATGI